MVTYIQDTSPRKRRRSFAPIITTHYNNTKTKHKICSLSSFAAFFSCLYLLFLLLGFVQGLFFFLSDFLLTHTSTPFFYILYTYIYSHVYIYMYVCCISFFLPTYPYIGQYWGENGYFRVQAGLNLLNIERQISWVTPHRFSVYVPP